MSKVEVKTVTEYLDTDYRQYAVYVVEERAIPSVIDGLKPTQRKVVFVADRVWKNGSEKQSSINVVAYILKFILLYTGIKRDLISFKMIKEILSGV